MELRWGDLVRTYASQARLRHDAVRLGLLGFLAASVSCGDNHARLPPDAPVVRRIDHVLVVSNRAEALFVLFADLFQCPVVWPMADHGGFASGGVSLGNVTLEIIQDNAPAAGAAPSRFTGIALEPEPLEACLPALTARGIAFGRPSVHRSGWFSTRWTTVGLPGVSSEALNVFLCEYGPAVREDLPGRRQRARDALDARAGGPLSLDGVREVVIATRDPAHAQALWQAVLHPTRPGRSGWLPLAAGPGLHIVAGTVDADHIAALVLQVRSLDQAQNFLRRHGLLGRDAKDQVSIAAPHLGGIAIHLVAAESAHAAPTIPHD